MSPENIPHVAQTNDFTVSNAGEVFGKLQRSSAKKMGV